MPALFWVTAVFAAFAIISFAARVDKADRDAVRARKTVRTVATSAVIGLAIVGMISIIPARSVGVPVTFGRPGDSMSNGVHVVAPWTKVEKFSTALQDINLAKGNKGPNGCVTVRIGNNANACVDINGQWKISKTGDGVVELYKEFKTFDAVETRLVRRQLENALSVVMSSYNPLAGIGTENGASEERTLPDLAARVRDELQKAVGDGITVKKVQIPRVHHDKNTEKTLSDLNVEKGNTRIAEQRRLTAEKTALANKVLNDSEATRNGGVLYLTCLEAVERLAARDQLKNLPPGFSCSADERDLIINGAR